MDRFKYEEEPNMCIGCFEHSHPDLFHDGQECPRSDAHAVCPSCGYCQECSNPIDVIADEIEDEDL